MIKLIKKDDIINCKFLEDGEIIINLYENSEIIELHESVFFKKISIDLQNFGISEISFDLDFETDLNFLINDFILIKDNSYYEHIMLKKIKDKGDKIRLFFDKCKEYKKTKIDIVITEYKKAIIYKKSIIKEDNKSTIVKIIDYIKKIF